MASASTIHADALTVSPTTAATSVATPTPRSSAWPRDNSAMCAVVLITLWYCANNGEDGKLADKPCTKMSTLPKEAKADPVDAVPAALPTETAATAPAPAIAHPALLPTVPPIAHPPGDPTDPIAAQTPHWYSQDSIEVIPADSLTASSQPEGSLYTEKASDGQTTFYTRLQLPSHDGMKHVTVKIDPGAQVNSIPLSKYCILFPPKIIQVQIPQS